MSPNRLDKAFYVIALLWAFLGQKAYCQELRGWVTDIETNEPLPAVSVVNVTGKQATMANESGFYSLSAHKGDSIVFSFVGYESLALVILGDGDEFRRVGLKRKYLSLDAIEIKAGLSPYQVDSLRRLRTYGQALSMERASGSVLGAVQHPISALAEQLNRRSKQRRKFQDNYYKWEEEHYLDTKYSPKMVAELTGLTGDTLATFMNEYPLEPDFARKATELELKMWVRYNYRSWSKDTNRWERLRKVESATLGQ